MDEVYTSNLAVSTFISEADLVVKIVIFLLFLASFWSWAIIFDKLLKFRNILAKANRFENQFWASKDISALYKEVKTKDDHTLSHVFVSAMNEWQLTDIKSLKTDDAKDRFKERLFEIMMVAKNRSIRKIEKNVNFLATVSSAAPFIGLFGTVWGIMNSFSAIVGAQNTSLAVVAPGIAEALFATAIGLFAAIPALIFYNFFVNKLNLYSARAEDFAFEVINFLSRELDKK